LCPFYEVSANFEHFITARSSTTTKIATNRGISHKISPLDFTFECLHFPPNIWSKDFKDPTVCILISKRPGKRGSIIIVNVAPSSYTYSPVEIENYKLPIDASSHG
jgi:hypothetical protein